MTNVVISVGVGRLSVKSEPVLLLEYNLASWLDAVEPYVLRPPVFNAEMLFGAQGILGPPNWVVQVNHLTGTVQLIA